MARRRARKKIEKQPEKLLTWKHAIYVLIVIANIIAVVWIQYVIQTRPYGPFGSTHIHADFKVYLDGEQYSFNQDKYGFQSELIHLHVRNDDPTGSQSEGGSDVIHMHATGMPLGYFFNTLGITFNENCFVLDTGQQYCDSDGKILKMFVKHEPNGEWERNLQMDNYIFQDLDKILITYGDDSPEQIAAQEATITNEACIQSKKPCP